MCTTIKIGKNTEIESPKQFKEYFGFMPRKHELYDSMDIDSCFCQCNLPLTFKSKGIKFKFNGNRTSYVIRECVINNNDK